MSIFKKISSKLRSFFNFDSFSQKSRSGYTVYSKRKSDTTIISDARKKTESYLENGRKKCQTIMSYQLAEKGVEEIVREHLSKLNQNMDSAWLEAENKQTKAQKELDRYSENNQQEKLHADCDKISGISQDKTTQKRAHKMNRWFDQLKMWLGFREQYKTDLEKLSKKLPEKINHHTKFTTSRVLTVLGIIVCSFAEAGNAMNSLMILRSNPVLELFTVTGLALGLVVLSKGIVYLFSNGNICYFGSKSEFSHTRQPFLFDLGGLILLTFSSVFIVLLGELRIAYMHETGVEVSYFTAWFLRLLGIALFASTLMLTMLLSNPKGSLKALYNRVLKQFKRADKKVQRLQTKIARKETHYLNEHSRQLEQLETAKIDISEGNITQLKDELEEATAELNSILALSRQSKFELIHACQAEIYTSRALFESKQNSQEKINWHPFDLTEILEEPVYQHPFETKMESEENINHKNTANMNHKKNGASILSPMIIIFGLFFGFASCQESEPNEETIILHVLDQTSHNDLQEHVTPEEIIEIAGLNHTIENGVEYQVSTINDVTVNKTYSASLEASEELITNTFIREEEIETFKNELDGIFTQIYDETPNEYAQTDLYIPLVKLVEEYQMDTRKKIVLLQSDCVENSDKISFLRYQSDLEKNPEKIREILEEVYPIPSISNTEIIILYQPNADNNDLFVPSANVFADLFRLKGATVSIKANL